MMKRSLAGLLQAVVVLIGAGVLAFLLWEPHLEGRNAHASTLKIYFKDPFLAYVYLGSTPFFVALYRAFGLFGHLRRHGAAAPATMETLRAIKRCGIALLGCVAVGVVIIFLFGDKDDRPAGFFMSFLVALVASFITTAAAVSARKLQRALGKPGQR